MPILANGARIPTVVKPSFFDKLRRSEDSFSTHTFSEGTSFPTKTKDVIQESKYKGSTYTYDKDVGYGGVMFEKAGSHKVKFSNNDCSSSGYYIGRVLGSKDGFQDVRYRVRAQKGIDEKQAKEYLTTSFLDWPLDTTISPGNVYCYIPQDTDGADEWYLYEIIQAGKTHASDSPETGGEAISQMGAELESNNCKYKLIAYVLKYSALYRPKVKAKMTFDWGSGGKETCYNAINSMNVKETPNIVRKRNTTDWGTVWNDYQYVVEAELTSGEAIFFSIDGEYSLGYASEKVGDPGITQYNNRDTCLLIGSWNAGSCEVNADVTVKYEIIGWDLAKSMDTTDALADDMTGYETGETEEEIQAFNRFLNITRQDLIDQAMEHFVGNNPDLKLTDEFITVGDKGDTVMAIHEQLTNIGEVVDAGAEFTANSYLSMINLKKYMKQVDLELYNHLQIDTPCGTPPCSADEFPQCLPNSTDPCGCVTYATYAFIHHFEEQPEPDASTDWLTNFTRTNAKDVDTPFRIIRKITDVTTSIDQNNPDLLYVLPNDSLDITVKDGWEVKLGITAWKNGSQETTNFDGSAAQYVWLKGGDRLVANKHWASAEWPKKDSNNVSYNTPIYHLVRTENNEENPGNFTCQNQPTTRQRPVIYMSQESNVTLAFEMIDIRAPWSEWAKFGDSAPPGWGLEYGTSALTKFMRDFSGSITGDIEVGIYTGIRLSVLALIEINAGVFARAKFSFDLSETGESSLTMFYGFSASAEAGLGDYSGALEAKKSFPYAIDLEGNIIGEIGLSCMHLIHRSLVSIAVAAGDTDNEGLEVFGFDFSSIDDLTPLWETNSKISTATSSRSVKAVSTDLGLAYTNNTLRDFEWVLKPKVGDGPLSMFFAIKLSDYHKPHGNVEFNFGIAFDISRLDRIKSGLNADYDHRYSPGLTNNKSPRDDINGTFSISRMRDNLMVRKGNSMENWMKPGSHTKNLDEYLEFLRTGDGKLGAQGKNTDMVLKSSPLATKKAMWSLGMQFGLGLTLKNVPKHVMSSILSDISQLPLNPDDMSLEQFCVFINTGMSGWNSAEMIADETTIHPKIFMEIAGDFEYSWPFFSLWGIVYFYLIFKADAKLALNVNIDLEEIDCSDLWLRPNDKIHELLSSNSNPLLAHTKQMYNDLLATGFYEFYTSFQCNDSDKFSGSDPFSETLYILYIGGEKAMQHAAEGKVVAKMVLGVMHIRLGEPDTWNNDSVEPVGYRDWAEQETTQAALDAIQQARDGANIFRISWINENNEQMTVESQFRGFENPASYFYKGVDKLDEFATDYGLAHLFKQTNAYLSGKGVTEPTCFILTSKINHRVPWITRNAVYPLSTGSNQQNFGGPPMYLNQNGTPNSDTTYPDLDWGQHAGYSLNNGKMEIVTVPGLYTSTQATSIAYTTHPYSDISRDLTQN